MRNFLLPLLLCLSTCVNVPAFAQECRSTKEAMAYAAKHLIRPTIVRGEGMKPFVNAAGGAPMTTISFVAIVFEGEGAMAFFGNFHEVCGPLILSKEDVYAFLRPT